MGSINLATATARTDIDIVNACRTSRWRRDNPRAGAKCGHRSEPIDVGSVGDYKSKHVASVASQKNVWRGRDSWQLSRQFYHTQPSINPFVQRDRDRHLFGSMFDSKIKVPKYDSDAFDNVEYELQMTYTLETDRRIMSFYDAMWGMEVTGGIDQFEPLTIVNVSPTGLAKRGGMRIGDEITQINDVPALELTFNEALQLFRKSSRYVRVYVRG